MANLTGTTDSSAVQPTMTWDPCDATDSACAGLNASGRPADAAYVIEVDASVSPMIVYSTVDKALILAVMPLIFSVGVLGNGAVIAAFARYSYMRTVTNHYLVSLAVADLTFLLFSVPQFWLQYLTTPLIGDYTHLPRAFCGLSIYLTDSALIASGLVVMLVTFERYTATCWPFHFRRFSSRRRTVLLCAAVWLFSLAYKVPSLLLSVKARFVLVWRTAAPGVNGSAEGLPQSIEYCEYCFPRDSVQCVRFRKSLTFDQLLLLSVIPVTCVLYTLTMVQLQRSASAPYVTVVEGVTSNLVKRQVVRMLIVTILVYVVCITPFRLLNLFNIYDHQLPPNLVWVFVNVSRIMAYTNSAVNPFIYNVMSEKYRRAFLDLFIWGWPCCPARRRTPGSSGSGEIEMKFCRLPSDRRYV